MIDSTQQAIDETSGLLFFDIIKTNIKNIIAKTRIAHLPDRSAASDIAAEIAALQKHIYWHYRARDYEVAVSKPYLLQYFQRLYDFEL